MHGSERKIEDKGQHTTWQLEPTQVRRRNVRDPNNKLALLEATATEHKPTAVQTLHSACPEHGSRTCGASNEGKVPDGI